MATDVIMPALGMAQDTGRLVSWFKQEGEQVAKGEMLMEIETDKSVVEIEAPASGILANVTAAVDDEIPVGQRIALILAKGEEAPPQSAPGRLPAEPEGAAAPAQEPGPTATDPPPANRARRGRTLASPAARRIAREQGIDLAGLQGTGPEGAVIARDLPPGPGGAARNLESGTSELIRVSNIRRIIAERMASSKRTAPHFYLNMDVDMSGVETKRGALKQEGSAFVPSINDFILSAVGRALAESPAMNAALTDDGVEQFSDVNLGVAVAVDDGLVVPVIRHADRLSLPELARLSRDLAEKAQSRKLTPQDYQGGTFTVSNLGMFGVDSFTAIINRPQCGILAVGRVAPRVVAYGEGIAVRSMMTMTLSADHRVVDGAIGARFLQKVRENLEKD